MYRISKLHFILLVIVLLVNFTFFLVSQSRSFGSFLAYSQFLASLGHVTNTKDTKIKILLNAQTLFAGDFKKEVDLEADISDPEGALELGDSSEDDSLGQVSTNAANNRKFLIFVCDRQRSCGGWGDRQRGLVGTFLLSLVTDRKFGVIMTNPCNLSHFFSPNDVNWTIPDKELQGRSNLSLDDVDSKLKLVRKLKMMDFNKEFPQDVIYLRSNAGYWLSIRQNLLYTQKLPKWAQGSRALAFASGWRTLMKPSDSLQNRLENFLKRIHFRQREKPFVCAHVRMGHSNTIKGDTAVRCNISDLPILWDFVDNWVKNGSLLFLATDSWQVRNLTRQRFGERMCDSGGEILHVDRQSSKPNACSGFESAVLDQLILIHCDVLIVSNSIFSERAAFLRGKSENLYSFLSGKIIKRHRLGR